MVFTFERLFAFLRAFRREPTPYERALRALDSGQYADALTQFDDLLASLPANDKRRLTVENKRGIALIYLGRKDEARAVFESILASDPVYVPALVNLGNMALESGNLDEAVTRYESALHIDDFYPGAHFNLGVAYKRLGRTADAVRELRRATSLEGRAQRSQSTY
jgi:tetratricopeptide (TPR) repeat protein